MPLYNSYFGAWPLGRKQSSSSFRSERRSLVGSASGMPPIILLVRRLTEAITIRLGSGFRSSPLRATWQKKPEKGGAQYKP